MNEQFFVRYADPDLRPVRDLVGYGEHPPKITWQNGAKVAIQMVVNYEEGSEKSFPMGDGENDVLGEDGAEHARTHRRGGRLRVRLRDVQRRSAVLDARERQTASRGPLHDRVQRHPLRSGPGLGQPGALPRDRASRPEPAE